MSAPDESLKGYPRYKLIQWSATLAMLLLLLAGSLIGQYPPPLGQLGFCAFGIATGAAFARMSHPPGLPLTRLGQIGLIFVAASQVFFQSLVWSESWRVHDSYLGWRLWWISVVAGRRELGGKLRPHHTGLHRTPRPVINVASLAQQSFRGGTPGFAVAAPVIAVGGSRRLTGDHWALVEEPSTARAPASSLDATGHHHHGISGPEHRQLLFRPHHHAAAKPVR